MIDLIRDSISGGWRWPSRREAAGASESGVEAGCDKTKLVQGVPHIQRRAEAQSSVYSRSHAFTAAAEDRSFVSASLGIPSRVCYLVRQPLSPARRLVECGQWKRLGPIRACRTLLPSQLE